MSPLQARIVRILRSAHKWIGLALLAPLILIAASGTALIFDQQIIQGRLPELRGEPPASIEATARDLQTIDRLAGDLGWNLARLPQEDRPYYDIWLMSDERAYLAPGADSFADRFFALERPETFLYELHAHLLSGDPGELAVAWIGVGALTLSIAGLFVWWPGRRSFKLRHIRPDSGKSRAFLRAHSALMALAAPAVLILVVSGVMTAFPQTTERALGAVLGGPAESERPAETFFPHADTDWAGVLRAADNAFADDELVMLFRPAPGEDGLVWFRTRRAEEWHPNGRSEVYVDASGPSLAGSKDALAHGAGVQIALGGYPVHAVRGGAFWLTPVGLLSGAALVAGPLFGLFAFARRRREQRLKKLKQAPQ